MTVGENGMCVSKISSLKSQQCNPLIKKSWIHIYRLLISIDYEELMLGSATLVNSWNYHSNTAVKLPFTVSMQIAFLKWSTCFVFWEMVAPSDSLCVSLSLSHSLSLPSGYSPTIKGQLLHVDTTSSMQYRTLLEAEMLAVSTIRKLSSWLLWILLNRGTSFYGKFYFQWKLF